MSERRPSRGRRERRADCQDWKSAATPARTAISWRRAFASPTRARSPRKRPSAPRRCRPGRDALAGTHGADAPAAAREAAAQHQRALLGGRVPRLAPRRPRSRAAPPRCRSAVLAAPLPLRRRLVLDAAVRSAARCRRTASCGAGCAGRSYRPRRPSSTSSARTRRASPARSRRRAPAASAPGRGPRAGAARCSRSWSGSRASSPAPSCSTCCRSRAATRSRSRSRSASARSSAGSRSASGRRSSASACCSAARPLRDHAQRREGPRAAGRPEARTAIVMPICEEPVDRVFAGLRAIHASLEREAGARALRLLRALATARDPSNAGCEEEAAWFDWCRETHGFGRIFYRRRKRAHRAQERQRRRLLPALGHVATAT